MKELIRDYPLFSYIAVPVLILALVILTYFTIKPDSSVKNHFSKLYNMVLGAIDFIGAAQKSFNREKLSTLSKMIVKMKRNYEQLESDELYEVEGIIDNINKAASIARALIVAKAREGEIADFLQDIGHELKQVRAALYGFSLTRDASKLQNFTVIGPAGAKKNRQKADEYLKMLKR